jgi:hypothetical protein
MVGRPNLTSTAGTDTRAHLSVDQAIFTSMPSSVGEGYRIIAASSGLVASERAELTRSAPSHGSLIEDDGMDGAFLVCCLASGRLAIGWVRNAGMEHTRRGGERIHTHFAILRPDQYGRFACNPVRVVDILSAAVGKVPELSEKKLLPQLLLDADPAIVAFPVSSPERESALATPDASCALAASLLEKTSALMVARSHAREILEWALMILPLAHRACLPLSFGLRFTPSRGRGATVLPAADPQTLRAVRGQPIRLLGVQGSPTPPPSEFSHWLDFVVERWGLGQFTALHRLTGRINFDAGPAALERIADIVRDRDRIDTVDAEVLQRVIEFYVEAPFSPELERDLVDELLEAGRCRLAALGAASVSAPESAGLAGRVGALGADDSATE